MLIASGSVLTAWQPIFESLAAVIDSFIDTLGQQLPKSSSTSHLRMEARVGIEQDYRYRPESRNSKEIKPLSSFLNEIKGIKRLFEAQDNSFTSRSLFFTTLPLYFQ